MSKTGKDKQAPPVVEEEEEEEEFVGWNIKKILALVTTDGAIPSPIDINVIRATQFEAPCLIWHHYDDMPKKMKLTNTGQTLILSAKWHKTRPYLTGGCLTEKYIISQMHFHWGKTGLEGSSHTIDDNKYN